MKLLPPMLALVAMSISSATVAQTVSTPRYGARLEGFAYPHPVRTFAFQSQDQRLEMAYLDVAAPPHTTGVPSCCCMARTSVPPPGSPPSRR